MNNNNNDNVILLTKEGYDELNIELKNLIEVIRPNVIKELVEAREQGDLSENADYDAARNRQAEVESRIKELETIFSKAKVISNENAKKKNEIRLGSNVTLLNLKKNQEIQLKIVGPIESEPFEGKISNESPVAKAILGKVVGEEVEVKGIKNAYKVKILEVK